MGQHILHLIRHGHYHTGHDDPLYGHLTDLGRQQASTLATAFDGFGAHTLWSSTMPRADETADIIAGSMPGSRRKRSRLMCELIPAVPDYELSKLPGLEKMDARTRRAAFNINRELREAAEDTWAYETGHEVERGRAKKVFERLFTPWSRKQPRHDVVVIHGNLIRYLVCRVIGAPPESWLNMDINHASVTRVVVGEDGAPQLQSFNETMHIPDELISS